MLYNHAPNRVFDDSSENSIDKEMCAKYLQRCRENLVSLVQHSLLDKTSGGTLNSAYNVYADGVRGFPTSGDPVHLHQLVDNMRRLGELLNRRTAEAIDALSKERAEELVDKVDGEMLAKHYDVKRALTLKSRAGARSADAFLTLQGASASPGDDRNLRLKPTANQPADGWGAVEKCIRAFHMAGCLRSCLSKPTPASNLYSIVGRKGEGCLRMPSGSNPTIDGAKQAVFAVGQCGPYITFRYIDGESSVFSSGRFLGVDDNGKLGRFDCKLDAHCHFSIV